MEKSKLFLLHGGIHDMLVTFLFKGYGRASKITSQRNYLSHKIWVQHLPQQWNCLFPPHQHRVPGHYRSLTLFWDMQILSQHCSVFCFEGLSYCVRFLSVKRQLRGSLWKPCSRCLILIMILSPLFVLNKDWNFLRIICTSFPGAFSFPLSNFLPATSYLLSGEYHDQNQEYS